MAFSIRYNAAYVLESLRPGERRTGSELYRDVLLPRQTRNPGFTAHYDSASSAVELRTQLQNFVNQCGLQGWGPIIHIEAHGREDGIVASDGSLLSWAELAPILRQSNIATRMNLLVTMASCFGVHMAKVLLPVQPAPLCMLIGSTGESNAEELRIGFQRFYETLLDGESGAEAFAQLRSAQTGPALLQVPAQLYFERAFKAYFESLGDPAEVERRVAAIIEQGTSTYGFVPLDAPGGPRAWIRQRLADKAYWFDRFYRKFFMIDQYPENAARFPMSLADVV